MAIDTNEVSGFLLSCVNASFLRSVRLLIDERLSALGADQHLQQIDVLPLSDNGLRLLKAKVELRLKAMETMPPDESLRAFAAPLTAAGGWNPSDPRVNPVGPVGPLDTSEPNVAFLKDMRAKIDDRLKAIDAAKPVESVKADDTLPATSPDPIHSYPPATVSTTADDPHASKAQKKFDSKK